MENSIYTDVFIPLMKANKEINSIQKHETILLNMQDPSFENIFNNYLLILFLFRFSSLYISFDKTKQYMQLLKTGNKPPVLL